MVLVQRDVHMQKDGVKLLLRPYKKINSKLIKDLNIRAKTIKLLEENTEVNLHDLLIGNRFLDTTLKTHATEEKIGKLDFAEIKNFLHQRTLSRK